MAKPSIDKSTAQSIDERAFSPRFSASSAIMGAVVGVQLMLGMFIFAPERSPAAASPKLTRIGAASYHPEYDLPIYVIGCIASLACIVGIDRGLDARARSLKPRAFPGLWAYLLRFQIYLISALLLFDICALVGARSLSGGVASGRQRMALSALIVGAGVVAWLAIWRALRGGRADFEESGRPGRPLSGVDADRPVAGETAILRVFKSLAGVLAIWAILYIPRWRLVAGYLAGDNPPFHHWDFFVVGPSLSYMLGGALGTDVYSQYGVGWPMLVALGSRYFVVDHAVLFHCANVFGCLYYCLAFLALNWYLKDWSWGASGTLLVILCQTQVWYNSRTTWGYPGSSVLRCPMDVPFFIAVLLHLRSDRAIWALMMGVAAGLSLIFETDTGVILASSMVVYLASRVALARRDAGGLRRAVGHGAIACAVGMSVFLAGLAVASRGTILSAAFWVGWTEPIRIMSGGMTAIPMSRSGATAQVLFSVMCVAYLAMAGNLLVRISRGMANPSIIAAGCLAIYGLGSLVVFVNRSIIDNLTHLCHPFLFLAICVAANECRKKTWVGPTVLGLSVLTLGLFSNWVSYPSLAKWAIRGKPAGTGPMVSGTIVSDPQDRGFALDYVALVAEIKRLRANGESVCVLDPSDSLYYSGAGFAPPGRYNPMMANLAWREQLESVKKLFTDRRFDAVFSKPVARNKEGLWGLEILDEIRPSLMGNYVSVLETPSFIVWRRQSP